MLSRIIPSSAAAQATREGPDRRGSHDSEANGYPNSCCRAASTRSEGSAALTPFAEVRLGGLLGKGSFGSVYCALRGEQMVAVKVRCPLSLFLSPRLNSNWQKPDWWQTMRVSGQAGCCALSAAAAVHRSDHAQWTGRWTDPPVTSGTVRELGALNPKP